MAAQNRFFATGFHPYAVPPWSASVTRHFIRIGHGSMMPKSSQTWCSWKTARMTLQHSARSAEHGSKDDALAARIAVSCRLDAAPRKLQICDVGARDQKDQPGRS